MYLEKLTLVNFKNFRNLSIDLSEKINCFVGDNGVGKTNILDSVYYLSFTKSYFNPSDVQNIFHGEKFMMIEGGYRRKENRDTVVIALQKGQKKLIKRNGKIQEKVSDYVGLYPLVIVSPADADLIAEGSAARRKFIDGVISQLDGVFLQNLLRYNKTLEQRNAILRAYQQTGSIDVVQLDVYDGMLGEIGQEIFRKRSEFVGQFADIFQTMYASIASQEEKVRIDYVSDLNSSVPEDLFRRAREKDLRWGYSTCGVHRDDLRFSIGGYPVKKFGSQGQQKTFLISLKLAQFMFMQRKTGLKPILLLDDIFDKLDSNRVEYIMKLVNDSTFGQIFISDTHSERIENLVKRTSSGYKIFDVNSFSSSSTHEIS